MLALAIILTIVTGLLFAIGGYIAYVKIREFHRNNVSNPNSGTTPGESPNTP